MESQTPLESFEAALLQGGIAIEETEKPAIEAWIASLAVSTTQTVVAAVNAKLTSGGVAGLVEAPIKKADVAAETTIEEAEEGALDALLEKLDALAKAALAKIEPVPEPAPAEGTPPAAT